MEDTVAALWAFSVDEACAGRIGPAVEAIIRVGRRHIGSHRVAENVLGLLWELAGREALAMAIVDRGGLETIRWLLGAHSDAPAVLEHGHGCLWALCAHRRRWPDPVGSCMITERVREEAGVAYLFSSLRWHVSHVGFIEHKSVHAMPMWLDAIATLYRAEAIEELLLEELSIGDLEAADLAAHMAKWTTNTTTPPPPPEFPRNDDISQPVTSCGVHGEPINERVGEGCGIDSQSALDELTPAKCSIRHVRLGFNRIGDEGAAALATGIHPDTSLTCLDLEGNQIGDDGADAIIAALEASVRRVEVRLQGNPVSADRMEAIASLQGRRIAGEKGGLVDGSSRARKRRGARS